MKTYAIPLAQLHEQSASLLLTILLRIVADKATRSDDTILWLIYQAIKHNILSDTTLQEKLPETWFAIEELFAELEKVAEPIPSANLPQFKEPE